MKRSAWAGARGNRGISGLTAPGTSGARTRPGAVHSHRALLWQRSPHPLLRRRSDAVLDELLPPPTDALSILPRFDTHLVLRCPIQRHRDAGDAEELGLQKALSAIIQRSVRQADWVRREVLRVLGTAVRE